MEISKHFKAQVFTNQVVVQFEVGKNIQNIIQHLLPEQNLFHEKKKQKKNISFVVKKTKLFFL